EAGCSASVLQGPTQRAPVHSGSSSGLQATQLWLVPHELGSQTRPVAAQVSIVSAAAQRVRSGTQMISGLSSPPSPSCSSGGSPVSPRPPSASPPVSPPSPSSLRAPGQPASVTQTNSAPILLAAVKDIRRTAKPWPHYGDPTTAGL